MRKLERVRFAHAAGLVVAARAQHYAEARHQEKQHFFERQVLEDEHVQATRLVDVPDVGFDGDPVNPGQVHGGH